MTQQLLENIQDCLDHDIEEEEIDQTARKLLQDLILLADEHEFSKEGLIREIQEGINNKYISTVSWKNGETKDLDLERLARTGEVRAKLEQQDGKLKSEGKDWPEKVVLAELEV